MSIEHSLFPPTECDSSRIDCDERENTMSDVPVVRVERGLPPAGDVAVRVTPFAGTATPAADDPALCQLILGQPSRVGLEYGKRYLQ